MNRSKKCCQVHMSFFFSLGCFLFLLVLFHLEFLFPHYVCQINVFKNLCQLVQTGCIVLSRFVTIASSQATVNILFQCLHIYYFIKLSTIRLFFSQIISHIVLSQHTDSFNRYRKSYFVSYVLQLKTIFLHIICKIYILLCGF